MSVTLTPSTATVPPLFGECRRVVVGDALTCEPGAELDLRDDRAAEPLVDRDGVADVVAVTVREQR